jgi:hypothetical protein
VIRGDSIGEVRVEIVALNSRTGARSETIVALADTGATLTVIPGEILDGLGIHRGLRRQHRADLEPI